MVQETIHWNEFIIRVIWLKWPVFRFYQEFTFRDFCNSGDLKRCIVDNKANCGCLPGHIIRWTLRWRARLDSRWTGLKRFRINAPTAGDGNAAHSRRKSVNCRERSHPEKRAKHVNRAGSTNRARKRRHQRIRTRRLLRDRISCNCRRTRRGSRDVLARTGCA